jgi:hypothetical protein
MLKNLNMYARGSVHASGILQSGTETAASEFSKPLL